MTSSCWKTVVIGLVLVSPLHLADRSSAEMSDPFAAINVNSALAHYSPKKQVAGAFKLQGSEALYPLLTRLSADFQKFQPKVNIDLKKESPKAVSEFLQPPLHKTGKIMMMDDRESSFKLLVTTHQFSDAEVKEFVAQHDYEPTSVPVAIGAGALYVHKENPLPGLTLDQADAMFSSTRKRGFKTGISQWGQLGLADGWKEATIQLHGCDRRSEARSAFQEHVLSGGEFKSSVQEHHGRATVIFNIAQDPTAIGYSGLDLHASNVRALPIAEKEGLPFVSPSRETVMDQTYPLRAGLYLHFDKSPKRPLPEAVQEFLTFIISREAEGIMMKAGLFPLPHTQAERRAVAFSVPTGLSQ